MKKIKLVCTLLVIMISLCGCAAYKEHSKDVDSVVGEWVLDSMYINTKNVDCPEATLVINEDFSGIYTEKVIKTTVDEAGNTVQVTELNDKGESVFVMEDESRSVSIQSSGEGVFTLTSEGVATQYRFNVDEAAGNLHMWIEIEGDEYHYIYIDKEVY